jgi:hypothetical protein
LDFLLTHPEQRRHRGHRLAFAVSWLCAAIGLATNSFADNQPVTSVTETVRALLLGHPAGSHLLPALAWTAGVAITSTATTAALFRRRTR